MIWRLFFSWIEFRLLDLIRLSDSFTLSIWLSMFWFEEVLSEIFISSSGSSFCFDVTNDNSLLLLTNNSFGLIILSFIRGSLFINFFSSINWLTFFNNVSLKIFGFNSDNFEQIGGGGSLSFSKAGIITPSIKSFFLSNGKSKFCFNLI